MAKSHPQATLTIKIDAGLAAEYRDAYLCTFGTRSDKTKTLADFIVGFVEDRLAEEVAFIEEEIACARR